MAKKKDVVYTVTIDITKKDLKDIVQVLNDREFDDFEEGDEPFTVEEILSKPKLLKYVCEMDYKDYAFESLSEYWNADGWCDIRKYR